jgi:hypothetical protein
MVVASTNNGAVENITLEVPTSRAVPKEWPDRADYFREAASAVVGEPCWALLSARLGNKQNRSDFLTKFWYGRDEQAADDPQQTLANHESYTGFLKQLKEIEGGQAQAWRGAVAGYKEARKRVVRLAGVRQQVADAVRVTPGLRNEIAYVTEELGGLARQVDQAEGRLRRAREAVALRRGAVDAASRQLDSCMASKPGLLTILLTLGRAYRSWSPEARSLRRALAEADAACSAAEGEACSKQEALDKLAHRAGTLRERRDDLDGQLAAALKTVQDFKSKSAALVPDREFWTGSDVDARELSAPWMDEVWREARAKLFAKALHLHRAFIEHLATEVRQNLTAAMDIIHGQVPEDAPLDAVRHAWAMFFLVIPVVSTTFASFGRLLSHFGAGEIGWLLIDEAGQAVPQAAVGGIWRSRRVLALGDPQQLEPVVVIPRNVVTVLGKHFDVAEIWRPDATSVQELADRANPFGTYLPRAEERIWVGAPLRVHRRCLEPMFSISNYIAYGGLMVFGTPTGNSGIELPESCWYDVSSDRSEGNWIPDEGQVATRLLEQLALTDGACLSPFRHVAWHLAPAVQARWPSVHVGTVHTYQGKETDVVLLVLGGSVSKEGPLNWAASRPNLLNVAVTRARKRLYVIGNRERWRSRRYFSQLARYLPLGAP